MATFERPGVYVSEVLNPPQQIASEQGSSTGMIAGVLDRGPTSPTLVRSWTEYRRHFGSFEGGDMAYAAYQYFLNGGTALYVTRVVNTLSVVTSSVTLDDRATSPVSTLTISAISPGVWGDDISVSITDGTEATRFNLLVYEGGTGLGNLRETWNDLSMDPTDAQYVERVVNHPRTGSGLVVAVDEDSASTSPEDVPAAVAFAALTGGDDGLAPVEADFDDLFATDGTAVLDEVGEPFNLNIPGWTVSTLINSAIAYAEYRGDVFVVIDPQKDRTVDQITTEVKNYTESSYGGVFYPNIWIGDPATNDAGSVKLVHPGGAVLGRFAATDSQFGPWKAAAGISVGIRSAVQLERKLSDPELATLNANHVNAIRNIRGTGIRIMGARTLKLRQADMYIPVRRTLIYIKDNLKRNTEFALFEPNDPRLWAQIRSAVSGFLRSVYLDGGLQGNSPSEAFYVKCDAELNTESVIAQGQVKIEVGVALLRPAEFVVITVGQWYGGSATASESTG